MGRRGPPPTPTSVLTLRGSTLVTQKRLAREMKGIAGAPRCPDWLDDDSKAAWKQLAPQLIGVGVLSKLDQNALARYCRLWSRWRKMEAFIDKHGEAYPLKDEAGKVKCLAQFPQVGIASKLAQQLTRLEQEFGLTPSARTRIQVQQSPAGTEAPASGKTRFFDSA